MVRYAQIIMGSAGVGKSTYCNIMSKHFEAIRRPVKIVNLDPAAEYFEYPVTADIRDLIQLDDVMDDESLHLGPNGGLVFCMEYFSKNFEWLHEQIDEDEDDDLILFDCPGQIELYTHLPIMQQFVEQLQKWNFRVCGVFIIDAQFLIDLSKFFSGILAALSVMVTLEIPHVNVLSKVDLLNSKDKEELERYLEADTNLLVEKTEKSEQKHKRKFYRLNKMLARIIDDYSLVKLQPLDINDEDTIHDLCMVVDNIIQYGEDFDVKEPKEFEYQKDNE